MITRLVENFLGAGCVSWVTSKISQVSQLAINITQLFPLFENINLVWCVTLKIIIYFVSFNTSVLSVDST